MRHFSTSLRVMGVLALVLALFGTFAIPALAADPVTMDPLTGPSGTTVNITVPPEGVASLAQYGLSLVIQVDGKEAAKLPVPATSNGKFQFKLEAAAGAHKVDVGYVNPTNQQFVSSANFTFTVAAAATQPAQPAQPATTQPSAAQPAQLPSSGDSLPLTLFAVLGGALFLAGVGLRRFARA